MNLGILDIVFFVVLALFAINGLRKGFISEIFSLAGVVLGLVCAYLFSDWAVGYVVQYWGEAPWNKFIVFILIFLVVYLIFRMIEKILSEVIEGSAFDKIDNILGLVAGLAKGGVMCIVLIIFLYAQPVIDSEKIFEGSVVTPFFLKIMPTSPELMPEYIMSAADNV